MVTEKRVFIVNGKSFDTREEAEAEERVDNFKTNVRKMLSNSPSIVTSHHDDIIEFLDTNSSELVKLFMELHQMDEHHP